ncbi:lamin tail domain-containing protein, partial [Candidatus Bipolaricaulota bacterium]|nr:lamin tail domain-containing protein [Candidatus Bipolaricaulota bacterium]
MVLLAVALLMVGLAALADDFIISEVAWAGTAASSADEWIELHNQSEFAIDLVGWQLVYGEVLIPLGGVAEGTLEVRTTVLAPGAFLVLERTDDDSISDITADLIYKGTLSNAGMLIELRNPQGEVVDSAVMTGESEWPAGSAIDGDPAYCTMERTSSGDWASNNGIVCNGLDAEGTLLNATPGQMNSSEVLAQWAPTVEIVFPSEEGTILSGIELIAWTAIDPNGEEPALAISVFISQGDENEWILLIENLANTGSFSWDTTEYASGDTYRLLVRAADPEGYFDEAPSVVFEISNADE